MKRLILSMLVLALFLTGLFMATANASWAGKFTNGQISYLNEDPNEPVPEGKFANGRISYLSEDPNESEEDNPPGE